MDKRRFLQYVAANSLALSSAQAWAQPTATPATPIHHTLLGQDSEGKNISLDSYAGQVCLVTFFAGECILCTKELKLMREFYMSNRKRHFILIGVSLDEKQSDFTEYMKLISLSVPAAARFPIVWRNAPNHKDSFGPINRKPTHFMLDKAHNQLLKREGSFQPNDWDNLWTHLG